MLTQERRPARRAGPASFRPALRTPCGDEESATENPERTTLLFCLENVCGADTRVCRLDTLVETFRASANLSSPQGVRSAGRQLSENLNS